MAKKHWIYIKRGLSEDPKHRARMGECVWLYMHIIDRADWETGIAYDWKDAQEAADMCMPVDTLRRQRQKLDDMSYISCMQMQHSQNITIFEWRNPREYGAEVKNPHIQGMHTCLSSDIADSTDGGQGDSQGSNEGLNQVTSQVRTPTSSSKSKSVSDKTKPPDFVNLTVQQAARLPELRIFREATGRIPGQGQYETVWNVIRDMNGKGNSEYLRPFWLEWSKRGYNPSGLAWLTDWAVSGNMPGNQKQPLKKDDGYRTL